MSLDIEALGFTKEELQDRVVEKIVASLMSQEGYDSEHDHYFEGKSEFANEIKSRVVSAIDAKVEEFAQQIIVPLVHQQVDALVVSRTNTFGEKQGEPVTFTEYVVNAANAFLMEKVDYEGKPFKSDGWGKKEGQTRVTYLLDSHLQYRVKDAMTDAVKQVTVMMVEGLGETAKASVQVAMEKVANAAKNVQR